MTVNAHAADTAKRYGIGYHAVRVAVNRIVNHGWERGRAERYVDEVLAARNDLDEAVASVLREPGVQA